MNAVPAVQQAQPLARRFNWAVARTDDVRGRPSEVADPRRFAASVEDQVATPVLIVDVTLVGPACRVPGARFQRPSGRGVGKAAS